MAWRYDSKTQEFKRSMLRAGNIVVGAANDAVKQTAIAAVAAGRANIASAGFSERWQKSLVYKMVTSKDSLEPVAYIHTRGNIGNIASVFEEGANIQGQPLLWLPLPSVPGTSKRKHMTPAQYVKNIGPLVSLRRPGKTPVLAAVIKRGSRPQPFGKFATKRQLKKGAKGKGEVQVIPLFVGVVAARVGKKWNVVAAMESVSKKMPQLYEDAVKKLNPSGTL